MVRQTRKKKRTNAKVKEGVFIGGKGADRCVFVTFLDAEGLGNQLFIYAAGYLVSKKTHIPLCIISKKNNPHSKTDYRTLLNATPVEETNVKPRVNSAKTMLGHVPGLVGKWSNANIHYNAEKNTKNLKLPGVLYQNYSSVKPAVEHVKAVLLKNEFNKPNYQEFKGKIDSKHTAFMHIRRGDYVGRNWNVPNDFYYKGLEELNKNANIKKICIVSDDLDWCKSENSNWDKHAPGKVTYVDDVVGRKPNELETLYVMTLCEAGAILSNSTFSSWGTMMGPDLARLHGKGDVTIVYPSPWIQTNGKDPNPLSFPSEWIPHENAKLK
jgi:Glycosyl transferase family 11